MIGLHDTMAAADGRAIPPRLESSGASHWSRPVLPKGASDVVSNCTARWLSRSGRPETGESANPDAFPIGFGGWYIAADPPAKHVLAAFARG